jgi:hypothetical protein
VVAIGLCAMLVLFPKGGVRLGGNPVTWAYVLLFLANILLVPYRFLAVKALYVRRQVIALACLVPYILELAYATLGWGIGPGLFGVFISIVISLVYLPVLFLWFFPPMLHLLDGALFLKWFRYFVLAAAIFGLIQFVYSSSTGDFLSIPYLSANADDPSNLGLTKNISRGIFFKLISTYNNGNIYGAATLIILPLYEMATRRRWERWILWLALSLTLSRTIWAGMLFDQALSMVALLISQRNNFPRINLGKLGTSFLLLGCTVPVFIVLVQFIGRDSSFLLDPTLGGRTGQFTGLAGATFFPTFPSTFGFSEIIYLSAVNLFGYIGFPVITLVLLSPLLVLAADRSALADPYRRAALKGLLIYAMICTSDGALNLIPVMAFYWFIYMIFIFGVPGTRVLVQPGLADRRGPLLDPRPLQWTT